MACSRATVSRVRVLRVLIWLVLVLVAAGAGVALAARFHDGPIALFPGGPLRSGDLVEDPNVDWSFAAPIREMELESDGRSRTTWLLVDGGQLYVPASVKFPPFKNWHLRALQDPRATVRIGGKRYRLELQPLRDPEQRRKLLEIAAKKYPVPPATGPDDIWLFRLAPPRGG